MKSLIWVSIIMTLVISGLFGIGAFFINPAFALGVFFISIGAILVITEPLNRILRAKSMEKQLQVFERATKLAEVNSKQTIALECEYCKGVNNIPIKLNNENSFDCKECNSENKVLITFATTRTSTPFTPSIAPEASMVDEMKDLDEVPDDEQPKR